MSNGNNCNIDKQTILDRTQELLTLIGATSDRSKKGRICPVCGSGTGKKGTGITSKDGIHWTCWANGCFTNSDIFGIVGKRNNKYSFTEQLQECCAILGIEPQQPQPQQSHHGNGNGNNTIKGFSFIGERGNTQHATDTPQAPVSDEIIKKNEIIQQTIKNAQERFTNDCEGAIYLKNRGFEYSFLKKWGVGYAENIQGLKSCIIIPTSEYSYTARTTNTTVIKDNRYKKQGTTHILNSNALHQTEHVVFVVEGELDALAVMQEGGTAIALGSTSNKDMFMRLCKKELVKGHKGFILALDTDEAGINASNRLDEYMTAEQIPHTINQFQGKKLDCKDIAELLQTDKAELNRSINEALEEYDKEITSAELEEYYAEHNKQLEQMLQDIHTYKDTTPTGFENLDRLLDGGLYAGLYFIGAISSLGKTTFCLQLAEQIAQNKQDVLIFSLEMASSEIIAKGISRNTFDISSMHYNTDHHAKTTRGVLTRYRYIKSESDEERNVFEKAVKQYGERKKHLFITEGVGNVGVNEIRQAVEKHKRITGRKPVVLIDYIQILAPYSEKSSDKQNTDKAVMELKRISRDFDVPIIGISSFNRDNYYNDVCMQSFKESGAIEYSSDVLLGLQYHRTKDDNTQWDAQERAKEQGNKGEPQEVELVILKNRNGRRGTVNFEFRPKYNHFTEID